MASCSRWLSEANNSNVKAIWPPWHSFSRRRLLIGSQPRAKLGQWCLQADFHLSFAQNSYPPFKSHRDQTSSIPSKILTPITNYNGYFPLSDFYFRWWCLKDRVLAPYRQYGCNIWYQLHFLSFFQVSGIKGPSFVLIPCISASPNSIYNGILLAVALWSK